ncbi:MAG TPA: VOC family protein [Trueperaceae bacterium]
MNDLRVNTVFIPVSDMERSRAWYERVLGLEAVADWGEYLDMRFLAGSSEQATITLHRVDEVPPPGTDDFNLTSPQPERVRRELAEMGERVTEPKALGEFVYFELLDPDGNEISIIGRAAGR